MVPGMRNFIHKARLVKLGLFSLEKRRWRGDLLEVYKIKIGLNNVKRKSCSRWLMVQGCGCTDLYILSERCRGM